MLAGHRAEDGRVQTLEEHLIGTAELCANFASAFGAEALGEWLGKIHDMGKAAPGPQKRIMENGPRADHSTFGAQVARGMANTLAKPTFLQAVMGFAVAGHHAGLPDYGAANDLPGGATLCSRLQRKLDPDCLAFAKRFPHELTSMLRIPLKSIPGHANFSAAFFVRMMFSCLVDADFLDTERFMSNGTIQRDPGQPLAELRPLLDKRMTDFREPVTNVERARAEVLKACENAGTLRRGLFTLTAPTGGGKTLASLAFALRHAEVHKELRRVIYAIPYTSIIKQNAGEFEKALGTRNVLAHYADAYAKAWQPDGKTPQSSVGDDDDTRRIACENWDKPVIVTTNVRFFESLFASRPGACRKLHNIAQSVIILDEAQMLPTELLRPCLHALAELIVNYGCSVLLMSATQPPLAPLFPKDDDRLRAIEITQNIPSLFQVLRRVTLEDAGTLTNAELQARMTARSQALVIVNSRRHAKALFDELPKEGRFHLSTLMTRRHLDETINEIRSRLNPEQPLPCRVVSTSLLECGVDLDFPIGFRARAGLDNVLQTAGRVNREGREAPENAVVMVFDEEEAYSSVRNAFVSDTAAVCKGVWNALAERMECRAEDARHEAAPIQSQKLERDTSAIPLDGPETVAEYFRRLYGIRAGTLDAKHILSDLLGDTRVRPNYPFREIADVFRLIDSPQISIIVTRDDKERALAQCLMNGEYSRELIRALGDCTVGVYPYQLRTLLEACAISEIFPNTLYLLTDTSRYSEETGLDVTEGTGEASFY